MRTFVLVTFWIQVFISLTTLLQMALQEFPKTEKKSLGQYAASALLGLTYAVWAGIVLWL